jgi:DNA-binding MarR family transcriptional regulator
MVGPPEPGQQIRAALLRKALADANHRAALARRLGLTENEVLAVQHLATAGELTPGELDTRLQLSSGGTTGLIQQLEQAGHLARRPHPRDRRSAMVSLTSEIQRVAADAGAPLVAELDSLVQKLSADEAETVRRFIEGVAEAAERHATRIAADADAAAHEALAVPLPALWA